MRNRRADFKCETAVLIVEVGCRWHRSKPECERLAGGKWKGRKDQRKDGRKARRKDGINYDTIEYFSKNIISLNILHLSKPKFNKLNFTQNANSDEKKIKIQEVSINILPTSIFYSNILLILNRNYYLWDRNTRLVILN